MSDAVWHNVQHQETGSLFQSRFKRIPVEGQGAWALVGCQYIHLNPVRVVTKLQKRPWDDFANQRGDWGRDKGCQTPRDAMPLVGGDLDVSPRFCHA